MTASLHEPADPPPRSARGAAAAPPLWPIERFFNRIGRGPAAAGRFLDRLAQKPVAGPAVRFFSSVWLGLLWLLLVAVYVGLGSGVPALRSWADLTDLEFFDAWPMVLLMFLLSTTLIVVTLRRIPLTVYRAGVWMVHVGIITLIVGCFFYFGLKHEGMVEIFKGQSRDHFYGTTTRALFVSMKKPGAPAAPPTAPPARPRPPMAAPAMAAAGAAMAPHMPATTKPAMVVLRQLPIFIRHTPGDGNPLNIPIAPKYLLQTSPALGAVRLRIVGYLPYAELRMVPVPRVPHVPLKQPAIRIGLSSHSTIGSGAWLYGRIPQGEVERSDAGLFDIQYLYHPSREKQREISTSFHGLHAVTVLVPKLHIRRTYTFERGKSFKVAGTPYTITPVRNLGRMPMVTPGYQNVVSSVYMLGVQRADPNGKTTVFQRAALFRFPGKSADFVMQDGRPTPFFSLYDRQIKLVYLNADRDQLYVVEHRSGRVTLVHRRAGGAVHVHPLVRNEPVPITLHGMQAWFALQRRGMVIRRPHTVPRRDRSQHVSNVMGKCLLQLSVSHGKWHNRHVYVPFNQFGPGGQGVPPTPVAIPGVGTLEVAFSNIKRPLPCRIKLLRCKEVSWPGGVKIPKDFISRVRLVNLRTHARRIALIHMNHPANVGGLHLFQARFGKAPDGTHYTVLGVGNTHGMDAMLTGVILIVLGIGYAFYVKPLLLRVKKRQLAEFAAKQARAE